MPQDEDRSLPFEQLVEKYHKKIFNLILRNVADAETALDITQDVFVRAYREMETARFSCTVHTWLCQLAIDEVKRHLRPTPPPRPELN